MKVLVITNLFPNNQEPGRGIFNKQQFNELKKFCEIQVVAPLPWRPAFVKSIYHQVPACEVIDSIKVFHPRYLVTPKVGRMFYGHFLYLGIKKLIENIYRDFAFDLIFATWGYPDIYAASLIADDLNKPLVSRVHGTDVNVLGQYPAQRKMMKQAFERSYCVITNSRPLKERVEQMGVAAEKIITIPNGVDVKVFRPLDQADCQQKLGWEQQKKHLVFIGNLVPIKGIIYLIQAVKKLRDDILLHIVGQGELEAELRREVEKLGLEKRVLFYGRKPHAEMPVWLNAADILCLPSLNEGQPNVVLEALACHTPVVASNVGAIPDLIDLPPQGRLVTPQQPEAIAQAVNEVFIQLKQNVKPVFEAITWQENAGQVYDIFKGALR